jgi:hypothetical protein
MSPTDCVQDQENDKKKWTQPNNGLYIKNKKYRMTSKNYEVCQWCDKRTVLFIFTEFEDVMDTSTANAFISSS